MSLPYRQAQDLKYSWEVRGQVQRKDRVYFDHEHGHRVLSANSQNRRVKTHWVDCQILSGPLQVDLQASVQKANSAPTSGFREIYSLPPYYRFGRLFLVQNSAWLDCLQQIIWHIVRILKLCFMRVIHSKILQSNLGERNVRICASSVEAISSSSGRSADGQDWWCKVINFS